MIVRCKVQPLAFSKLSSELFFMIYHLHIGLLHLCLDLRNLILFLNQAQNMRNMLICVLQTVQIAHFFPRQSGLAKHTICSDFSFCQTAVVRQCKHI